MVRECVANNVVMNGLLSMAIRWWDKGRASLGVESAPAAESLVALLALVRDVSGDVLDGGGRASTLARARLAGFPVQGGADVQEGARWYRARL